MERCAHIHRASTCGSTTPPFPPPHVPLLVTKTPRQADLAPKSMRGAREGAPARVPNACPIAPFGKPQPPPRRTKTALFSHHCFVTQCHAVILICLSEMAKALTRHRYKTNAWCAFLDPWHLSGSKLVHAILPSSHAPIHTTLCSHLCHTMHL